MQACRKCGSYVDDGVMVCPYCGFQMISYNNQYDQQGQHYGQQVYQQGQQYGQQVYQQEQQYGQQVYQQEQQYGQQVYQQAQPNSQQNRQYSQQGFQQPSKNKKMPGWAIALIAIGVSIPILAILAAAIAPAIVRYHKLSKADKEVQKSLEKIEDIDITVQPVEDIAIPEVQPIEPVTFDSDINEKTEDATTENQIKEDVDFEPGRIEDGYYVSETFGFKIDLSKESWTYANASEKAEFGGNIDESYYESSDKLKMKMQESGSICNDLLANTSSKIVSVQYMYMDGFSSIVGSDGESYIDDFANGMKNSSNNMTITGDSTISINGSSVPVKLFDVDDNEETFKGAVALMVKDDYFCAVILYCEDDENLNDLLQNCIMSF